MADFKAIFPDSPLTTFEHAGNFCQEDILESLVALIQHVFKSTFKDLVQSVVFVIVTANRHTQSCQTVLTSQFS